jgi:hypothetical protein
MTVVGKILVFFNLLASVAVGFFAVVDYSTRTRWAAGFNELEQANRVLTESRNLYKEQADKRGEALQSTREKLVAVSIIDVPDLRKKDEKGVDLKDAGGQFIPDPDKVPRVGEIISATLRAKSEQLKLQEAENERLRGALIAARKESTDAGIKSRVALEDVKQRQRDVEQMRVLLRQETDTNNKLIKDNNELRDKMVQAEIDRQTAQNRATDLMRQVEDLARQLERARTSGGAGAPVVRGTNPPPEDVEGLIKRTDASGLVTITLGSDAGIAKGHTLEVFRIKPLPKYLGQIRILSVSHKEAVGQPAGRLTGAIMVGDTVASRIQGR